jgi:hypothetical protein
MRIPSRDFSETLLSIGNQVEIDGKWVAARPEPYYSWKERWVLAWAVFTGKADALFWHKQ